MSYAGGIDILSKCPTCMEMDCAYGAFDPWAGLSNPTRLAAGPLIAATVWGGLAYALAPKKTKVAWGLGVALGTSLFVGVYNGYIAGSMLDQLGSKGAS